MTRYVSKNGYEFLPIVFESLGHPGKIAQAFLKSMMALMSEDFELEGGASVPQRDYWFQRLSVALQKGATEMTLA